MFKITRTVTEALSTGRSRAVAFVSMVVAAALMVMAPVSALATETATEEGVKKVAEGVGTEGVAIILAILTALVALLVAVIIIPKAVALIRRFV